MRGGVAPAILAATLSHAPAFAQDAAPQAAAEPAEDTIVVTGSLLRQVDKLTMSPITTVSAEDLAVRGITTVQQGIQSLSANNGPALTNGFSANGAFAGGASAVSLRGLSTSSTLVLFDGLRAAYYPLADDGTRNFVDLNTIPDAIVERVQVLKDGASATYGADAVAGVVNIITKREVKGLHLQAEAGVSEKGYGANQRLAATYGYGDLSEQGFNAYVSAHYLKSNAVYNRDLSAPYNSDNQSGICHDGVCGPNNIANGVDPSIGYTGLSTATNVFMVRPFDPSTNLGTGRYQLLNTAAGCGNLNPYTLTDQEYADFTTAPRTVCQQDITHDYSQVLPEQQRWGISGRLTKIVGDSGEAYLELNYENSKSSYTGLASIIRANAPAGIDNPAYSTSTGSTLLRLPVYVCARGTATCDATNGTLNPNNPYAAQGQEAAIIGRLPTSTEYNESVSQVFRAAAGIKGDFGDDWHYQVDGTAMVSKLKTKAKGYVYIQHLLDVIADGSYNFMNPSATSQDTLDYLTPTQINHSKTQLYQGQASISKDVFDLPGGPLQVAVGVAARYESLNNPSGNPDYNGPTERYFRLNAFGAKGHRDVESAYFEINAPVIDQLELNAAGRYDHYSTGQDNFAPKFGAKFKPIRQLMIRSTYSRGFRVPSFAEMGALPTTGYVTQSLGTMPDSYLDQHLNADGSYNSYVTTYSIGQTTVGNPELKAEKSRNFTLGGVFTPTNNLSFSVDYYNIKKTGAITSVDFSGAIANYYATGETSYDGVTIIQDEVDQAHPDAQRRIQYVQGSFINANTIKTSGIDFNATGKFRINDNITFSSSIDATYVIKLNTEYPGGRVEHYVDTLGNFNLTAGSGTQQWRGSWQNTVDFGRGSISATAYYTDGYNYSAEDQGGTAGDCSLVPTNYNGDAYQGCRVKSFISVDMTGTIKVNDQFELYANVMNVFNNKPPIDATTYGAYLYNPVVGESAILGRSFRIGAKASF
ncbi:TonB-dependent receptor domain-containing protein [Sphingobium rhizovicinum]|uniref:TonB-dependent receptor domain-containing protein n=1 Tax=Sphingobium rhizovicinum TaxID=432308 RepID=A0ABV7NG08_9SPHN